MNINRLAKIAHALSDPTRLRILETVFANKEINCSDIVGRHEVAPGTVSHHLKILAEAGLVESRREGQFIYNRANPKALDDCAGELSRLARQGRTRNR